MILSNIQYQNNIFNVKYLEINYNYKIFKLEHQTK